MKEIGLQLYTVRNYLEDEGCLVENLKRVKEAGYASVQLFGPLDKCEKIGLAAIEAGLRVLGTTGPTKIFFENPESTIALHKRLGCIDIGIGGASCTTLAQLHDFIKQANAFAKMANDAGLTFSYHNHSYEFELLEGKLIFDELIKGLDPAVKFVLDTYWVQVGGGDVRHWIEKLKGRIDILHLKDLKVIWGAPKFAAMGEGNMWWDGIIPVAEASGVKHFVVEEDDCGEDDPMDCIKISSDYLHKNFFD
jgi:sugar phosphate isomerase/epimerase